MSNLKAIKLGYEDLVEFLLEKDINLLIKNKSACNVFHTVAQYENINIMKMLLQKFKMSELKIKKIIFKNFFKKYIREFEYLWTRRSMLQ